MRTRDLILGVIFGFIAIGVALGIALATGKTDVFLIEVIIDEALFIGSGFGGLTSNHYPEAGPRS